MSKIGKKIIKIPTDVSVTVNSQILSVKGPKGELVFVMPKEIGAKLESGQLSLYPAIVANLVLGVKDGFEKKLEIEGIGFKVELKEKNLVLSLGFSHQVNFPVPDGINVTVEKNMIIVSGISKELVGQVAADIRALKKPEPYKGKGIHYLGEVIRRKAGKKVAGTTG